MFFTLTLGDSYFPKLAYSCFPITALPNTLDTLENEPGITINRTDPKTGTPYTYTITSGNSYTLSAEFSTESESGINNIWEHPAGTYRFQLTAKTLEQR
ncbi:hypothetical protein Cpha266_1349 [Chlorobium phaeobacteroides DSM 266]|uniref:Uncharacterized protein n=1 Tax=Chlorobium phaeobacteroides (strain DSM 266 / SMG 266 / 2430) TaxID=290317 RepID=A1BG53_CHLPD|nr:hypothetical protein Cpha266_1349 [Chlorobium phaeobacteroides DSM 266]